MQEFRVVDERRYPIHQAKPDELPYWRWEHRVTLGRGPRSFVVFIDNGIVMNQIVLEPPQLYIEESTTGNLEVISDDRLFEDLMAFATEKGYVNWFPPLAKDPKVLI